MKSIFKIFSIVGFGVITSSNVIACTTSNTSSLETSGYIIKAVNPNEEYPLEKYSDITYWSSSTISSDNFKSIFMENLFAKLKNPETGFNYFDMISSTTGAVNSDARKITGNNTDLVSLPILLLAQYELRSSDAKYTDIKVAYNQYVADFAYNFYQNKEEPITAISPEDVSDKHNPQTVFKLSFSVAIILKDQGKKDGFVGARTLVKASQNGANKTDISANYQDSEGNFLIDVSDKNLVGYNENDNKVYYTNDENFDYRFAVNLIFSFT